MGTILSYICIGIVVLLLMAGLFIILPCVAYFHFHCCKFCGHHMRFKGLKEDSDNGHYLFHCPHCGAWEQISKEEFLRNFNCKNYDSMNGQL